MTDEENAAPPSPEVRTNVMPPRLRRCLANRALWFLSGPLKSMLPFPVESRPVESVRDELEGIEAESSHASDSVGGTGEDALTRRKSGGTHDSGEEAQQSNGETDNPR